MFTRRVEFHPTDLPSSRPARIFPFFFHFFMNLAAPFADTGVVSERYIALGSNDTHRGNVGKPVDSQRTATPWKKRRLRQIEKSEKRELGSPGMLLDILETKGEKGVEGTRKK